MTVRATSIEGLYVVESPMRVDVRGFFRQSYQWSELAEAIGREPVLRQGNHSRSQANVLRGFHAEAWDKLLYVVHGTAMCVIADSRPGSPTFGAHEAFRLGDPPGEFKRLFVSEGLSNAFYCYSEVDYINDVSAEFDPTKRAGIRWDDETLAVEWPTRSPILSAADATLPTLQQLYPDHSRFAR